MILIPDIETVLILTPRTGTSSLRRAVMARSSPCGWSRPLSRLFPAKWRPKPRGPVPGSQRTREAGDVHHH